MRRIIVFAASFLALTGCPSPSETSGGRTREHASGGEEPRDELRDRPTLRRAGALARGTYLFEITDDSGSTSRRRATLESSDAGALELTIDGARRRTTREATWPMLCLARAIAYGDGALRVRLAVGAPVYVIAADGSEARVGPVPRVSHGRVLERDALSLEGCAEEAAVSAAQVVATPPEGDAACLFADPDPADESEGLPVPGGAPLEVLERDDAWARVRVRRAATELEGWLDASLVASDGGPTREVPDWSAAALRPGRCLYPDRAAPPAEPRAWIERSGEGAPAPDPAPFDATLRAADPRVHACWDELPAGARPARSVRLDVRIVVDGDGQVEQAAIVRSTGSTDALSRCVAERLRRIRFPAARGVLTLRRTYAFEPDRASSGGTSTEDDDDL